MNVILINRAIAEKLRNYEFQDEHKAVHKLDPLNGIFEGVDLWYLPIDLKENKIFAKALADFEVCEIKDIETFDTKYYDSKGDETIDISRVESVKTFLTIKK